MWEKMAIARLASTKVRNLLEGVLADDLTTVAKLPLICSIECNCSIKNLPSSSIWM